MKAETQQEHTERTRQMLVDTARMETRAAPLVEKRQDSIANAERQRGRWMTADAFMDKLRRVNPDLVMEPHPNKHIPLHADKACIYLVIGDHKEFLIVCEGDWMPEWSIMTTGTARKPDGPAQGYWNTVTIPWHEQKRGWRTVLIRLIRKNILSLEAVERVFGAGDRESWKVLTGKGPGQLLI